MRHLLVLVVHCMTVLYLTVRGITVLYLTVPGMTVLYLTVPGITIQHLLQDLVVLSVQVDHIQLDLVKKESFSSSSYIYMLVLFYLQ